MAAWHPSQRSIQPIHLDAIHIQSAVVVDGLHRCYQPTGNKTLDSMNSSTQPPFECHQHSIRWPAPSRHSTLNGIRSRPASTPLNPAHRHATFSRPSPHPSLGVQTRRNLQESPKNLKQQQPQQQRQYRHASNASNASNPSLQSRRCS